MKIESYIDHTLLKPEAGEHDIIKLCDETLENGFYGVCVNPCYVKLAVGCLAGKAKTSCVIGFPLGANLTSIKVAEALGAVNDGADELDMVVNVGALKQGRYDYVAEEIRRIKTQSGAVVKVILETAKLSDDEKIKGAELAAAAGADFVKTCTGFGGGQATASDVALLKKYCGTAKVKASGGIRDYASALELIEAGADRLGTSAGLTILRESREAER